ncbi:hypothetical protein A2X44_05495 [candidate division CPR3 bacterium GWF2_35_18]|uniref:Uncharacterized protein n=1 Tax=candidate division CPR3 bacterium GW2011_GWF2_35_18 TaxID=1618350 RepID=A0A0G0E130_UNCC3|nr:MAG: hypothetical protein UR67_C0010G0004 [candidate division CPR3 bacterium GW2011_GWF2_35_18]OGB63205.1 MAG: hypothetical protein A2X44_05495 [candidate division CPR3 bacterium GWF2_35_18]OGB64119.1 MAG: hypothetical protein A2250_03655 [candidate division CPR3 bacterium RIFOXYA2_FULL_35_13]OGB75577.1 MAG: hypothetical protein A2476_01770 [candidate division CPR3 bacterium RIFOXYC2_FULL_35_7]OGB79306.1 MAG: hypothetical protein A2296_02310 [candidate division CPR3 bacterium RIFOXYB2_FULL_3
MLNNNPSGITISGFLVSNDRDKVKKQVPDKLPQFDEKVSFKRYVAINFYPIEEAIKEQQEAIKIIYGDLDPQHFYEFGKIDFNTIIESQFGRIVKSLFFSDFKRGLLGASKLLESVIKGVKIQSIQKNDHEIVIQIDSDKLYCPEYWQGLLEAYMESFSIKSKVKVTVSLDKLDIEVKWF